MCVCVYVGCLWGGTRLLMDDICTCTACMWSQPYTIGEYSSWSGHKQGAVAEAVEIGERHWSRHKQGAVGSGQARLVLTRDATAWGLLVHRGMGLHAVHQTHADVVREGKTSKAYLCLQWRENCCAPCCANANGGESSSDLCTVKRATGVGLLT